VWWRCNGASSNSGDWRNSAFPRRPSQTNTNAPSRASCQDVLLPVMAIPLLATTGLSRGLCGQPKVSSGAHCLPSSTSTVPSVTGRPERSRALATWASDSGPDANFLQFCQFCHGGFVLCI
jgi:hypothetical protein